MKFRLKLTHNNITISSGCVKITKYSLYLQITMCGATHRVRIFIPYVPSIVWCYLIVFVTILYYKQAI